jgi:hypothetical protein
VASATKERLWSASNVVKFQNVSLRDWRATFGVRCKHLLRKRISAATECRLLLGKEPKWPGASDNSLRKLYFPNELLFVGAPSPTVPNELEQRASYAFGVRTSCGAATLIFSSLLTSFGTRGSQLQILPLRPTFLKSRRLRGLIWGTKLHFTARLRQHIATHAP